MSTPKSAKPIVSKFHFYSEVAHEIKTGDLLAWRITRIESFFTFILYFYQKWFGATYSHLAIAVRLADKVFVVEATSPKVRLIPAWMVGNFYLVRTGVKEERRHFELVAKHIGKSYGLFDMLKNMFNIRGSDETLYCSELVNDFFEEIGYYKNDPNEEEDDILTPDNVLQRVLQQAETSVEFVRIDKGNIHAT